MTSRERILQRIRSTLAKTNGMGATGGLSAAGATGGLSASAPAVPPVWPREKPSPAALVERFSNELKEVQGEVVRSRSLEEARRHLVELMDQEKWPLIGALDCTATRQLTAGLAPDRVNWVTAEWEPAHIATLPAGLIAAEKLLADTGSCLIACGTAPERLMCYLPPACVVVARVDQLAEHLPAVWETVAPRCADLSVRGEFVIVTGPSRTADIEKILILGVHGPKRLVVLLVG